MSDLEILVIKDMISLGYDPKNQEDIKLYWEMMLR